MLCKVKQQCKAILRARLLGIHPYWRQAPQSYRAIIAIYHHKGFHPLCLAWREKVREKKGLLSDIPRSIKPIGRAFGIILLNHELGMFLGKLMPCLHQLLHHCWPNFTVTPLLSAICAWKTWFRPLQTICNFVTCIWSREIDLQTRRPGEPKCKTDLMTPLIYDQWQSLRLPFRSCTHTEVSTTLTTHIPPTLLLLSRKGRLRSSSCS